MAKKKPKKKAVKKKAIKRKVAKKVIKRRPLKKKAAKKKAVIKKKRAAAKPKENVAGIVTHYFPKVNAAVVKLKVPLAIGDTVKIKGATTDFIQNITSMQIDRVPITMAKKGQEIGLLVDSRVRQHDIVYKA